MGFRYKMPRIKGTNCRFAIGCLYPNDCSPIPKRSFANKQTIVWLYANSSVYFDDVSLDYLMFGSSSPIPFFLSTTFSTKPRMRAAIPKQANMTRGHV